MGFTFLQKHPEYLPVHQHEKIEVPESAQESNTTSPTAFRVSKKIPPFDLKYAIWISWIVVLCLLWSNLYMWKRLRDSTIDDVVFSPASSAVRYTNIVPTAGVLDEISPYMSQPSENNNRLWDSLYDFGISRIPMSQAAQLANRTVPIPNDPGYYAVTLDVFHQLHCLNMIRKRVWSTGPMPEDGPLNPLHMDHCIDSIRQSLMCSSDITPIPYAWFPYYQMSLPTTGVLRTCRDFDALREWGRERQSFNFDITIKVDDPLGNVVNDGAPVQLD